MNRRLSVIGSGIALGLALTALFAACALVALFAPSVQAAHGWVSLFTVDPVTSPAAWMQGLFFSLLIGAFTGALFATVHNAVASRNL